MITSNLSKSLCILALQSSDCIQYVPQYALSSRGPMLELILVVMLEVEPVYFVPLVTVYSLVLLLPSARYVSDHGANSGNLTLIDLS